MSRGLHFYFNDLKNIKLKIMTNEEIEIQINRNNNGIYRLLTSDLPTEIILFRMRVLSRNNERLIEQQNK